MIVSKTSGNVLSSGGLQDTKTFQIRTNGHAFRMLSSGLYSDKIAAVVREIGCNASDAHIAGGSPHKPIEVKLPNAIDPQFYIKDFGIGLGHDDVMGLYSTYFASTKQQSNDMTGAFGLGSKSPFSYTDSFSVTACKDGKRRIYSAHIGEDDTPTVALMHEEDIPKSDSWQSGVMVGFPVKKEDALEFRKRAQQVYKFFPVPPTIVGGDPIKPLKILQDYTTFAFVEELPTPIVAVMGGVMYPVKLESLNLKYDHPLREAISSMSQLMLRVPIGSVQVAASREQLQFDENTRKYLIETLEKIVKNVVDDIVAQARACKTWKDRCAYAKKTKDTNGISMSTSLLKHFKVADAEKIMDMYHAWHYALPVPPHATVRQLKIEESDRSDPSNPLIGFKIKISAANASRGYGEYVDFKEDISIVHGFDDRPTVRIREAMKDGKLTGTVILLTVTDPKNPPKAAFKKALDELQAALVGVTVHDLATFPAPPLKKISRSKKKTAVFNDGPILFHGQSTKVTDVPANQRIYMRITSNGRGRAENIHHKGGEIMQYWDWQQIQTAMSTLSDKMGFVIEDPVLLKISDLKRVDIHRRPDWKHFEDYLTGILASKEFMDAITKYVGKYKYTVNLKPDPYGRTTLNDFLDVLVWMRASSPYWATHFEKIIKKHGMLDAVEEIHKNSLLSSVPQSSDITYTLDCIGNLSRITGVALSLPKFTGRDTTAFTKKLKVAANLDRNTLDSLLRLYPKSFEQILDEVLTRGV